MKPKKPGPSKVQAPNLERFRQAIEMRGKCAHVCGQEMEELHSSPLGGKTRAFLARHSIPKSLCALLEEHSYADMVAFGQLRFWTLDEIVKGNAAGGERRCITEGRLLVVGSGPSGDPIVVDLENGGTVGFLKHAEFYGSREILGDPDDPEAEGWAPVREVYAATPFDLGSFYLADALFGYDAKRAADREYLETHRFFACDFYSAIEAAKLGWDCFEEGLLAWESGRKLLPGLSYPLALERALER